MADMARKIDGVRSALAARLSPALIRWRSLATTAQQALAAAAVIAMLLLLWALWWRPLHQQRHALTERLPQLRAQLAAMRTQSEEVKRLRAVPAAVSGSSVSRLADVATLQELMGAETRVQLDASARFVISAKQMSYFQFIERLDVALGRFNLSMVLLKLTAVDGAGAAVGSVSVEALLADGIRGGQTTVPTK